MRPGQTTKDDRERARDGTSTRDDQEGRDPAPRQGRGKTRKMRRDHLEGLTARWAEAA